MRILHTADWHLGIDLHKMSLQQDQKDLMQQLIQIVIEEKIDVILISGDVYDTALASKEAIQLFDWIMTQLCKQLNKEVIVIAGNHDSGERLSSMSHLLSPMGLHVYGRIHQIIDPIILKDVAFLPIPYFHLETIRTIYQQPVRCLDDAFDLIITKGFEKTPSEMKKVVLAHTFCANASVSESDRFANIGGSDLVSSKVFHDADYVALGHLHKMQQLDHAYYSGSPLPYSFSEAKHASCVLIYDTEKNQVSKRSIEPLHPLITIKGSFEQIQKQLEKPISQQAYYKVELTDSIVSYETMEYFKEHLPTLLQLVGKTAIAKETIIIPFEQLEEMNDLDIVRHFFLDYYEEELDDEEIGWFLEVSEEKEEEYAS